MPPIKPARTALALGHDKNAVLALIINLPLTAPLNGAMPQGFALEYQFAMGDNVPAVSLANSMVQADPDVFARPAINGRPVAVILSALCFWLDWLGFTHVVTLAFGNRNHTSA